MQWILNLLYLSLDDFFEQFNNLHLPSWVSVIVPTLTNVFRDINYFVPLDTFIDVSIFCFNFNVALIVLKLILNRQKVNFTPINNSQ